MLGAIVASNYPDWIIFYVKLRVKCTWVLKLLGHYHLGTRTEKATTWVLKLWGHYHLGTRTKKPPTWVLKLLGHYHLGTVAGDQERGKINFDFFSFSESG